MWSFCDACKRRFYVSKNDQDGVCPACGSYPVITGLSTGEMPVLS